MWIPRFWLGCTNFGVQSCHYLLKMQLLATVQCTVYEDVDVVLWNSISTFYSTCPLFFLSTSVCICLCLHLCITVICLSITLEVTGSLFLFVLFSFNFFIWLLLPSQASEFPFLVPYILDSFKSLFFFNLEKDTLSYIWQAVWPQPTQKPLAFQIAPL